jgi:hypothetical protein
VADQIQRKAWRGESGRGPLWLVNAGYGGTVALFRVLGTVESSGLLRMAWTRVLIPGGGCTKSQRHVSPRMA